MIRAVAAAKINLSLRVRSRVAGGLHRLNGIFQSVSWYDDLTLDDAPDDVLRSGEGGDVIDGWDNLAWRALSQVRQAGGRSDRVELVLDKTIPAAAGLGGGSADAAASLAMAGLRYGVARDVLEELAAGLGSDVPFCLRGGTSEVGGTGEVLAPREPAAGYGLAIVVPPIELATGTVFAKWDELGEPSGPGVAAGSLPPSLRADGPLVNDLLPAAAALRPLLDDWRAELAARWDRPVLLTGSGPSLFAFFVDLAEAAAALAIIPPGARSAAAVAPVPYGWALRRDDEVPLTSVALDAAAAEEVTGLLAARS